MVVSIAGSAVVKHALSAFDVPIVNRLIQLHD